MQDRVPEKAGCLMSQEKTVLVVGATGLVGAAVVRHLRKQDCRVIQPQLRTTGPDRAAPGCQLALGHGTQAPLVATDPHFLIRSLNQ